MSVAAGELLAWLVSCCVQTHLIDAFFCLRCPFLGFVQYSLNLANAGVTDDLALILAEAISAQSSLVKVCTLCLPCVCVL